VAFHYPIFSPDSRFAGSVSALFAPEYLFSSIIEPVASNLPVDIFLMQTNGLMIYDMDIKQIGLNVFRDPLFKPFPELIDLAKKVAAANEGSGGYRFYRKVGEKPVTKVAYWRTVAIHGATWRLVITCATDRLEK